MLSLELKLIGIFWMTENNEDFVVEFSDRTMIETGGNFDDVCKIMNSDTQKSNWMIDTVTTIAFEGNITTLELHFYHNGDVYILDYAPSSYDVLYNMDIQYLSMWVQSHGWHIPEPHADLVRSNFTLWQRHWETSLVNSQYLESRIGQRVVEYTQEDESDESDESE